MAAYLVTQLRWRLAVRALVEEVDASAVHGIAVAVSVVPGGSEGGDCAAADGSEVKLRVCNSYAEYAFGVESVQQRSDCVVQHCVRSTNAACRRVEIAQGRVEGRREPTRRCAGRQ